MEVWFWLFVFLVVIPYIIITYNQFVSLKAQTDAQKSNIEAHLVRRANLYEKMASTLAAGTKFEKDFQKEIAQIRESGSGGIDKAAQVGERFKMMVARLEATPDIKAIGMMRDMRILETEASIVKNVVVVTDLTTALEQFGGLKTMMAIALSPPPPRR